MHYLHELRYLNPTLIHQLLYPLKRIRGRRSEPEDIVAQRLNKARSEMELRKNYKHVVTNDTIENASKAIIDIIKSVSE